MMEDFKLLSVLLCYPEADMIEALPQIQAMAESSSTLRGRLDPLLSFLGKGTLIDLQENYVATFDRNHRHSLHLFEHIHGESRDRGQAMVDLLQEYRNSGFDMVPNELPDYVPLFLEFLAQLPEDKAQLLLSDAIHVLALVGDKLQASESPYSCIFDVIRSKCLTAPQPFIEPPVRDMDEAMETFGPGEDGMEPLLKPSGSQTIRFYPKQSLAGGVQ